MTNWQEDSDRDALQDRVQGGQGDQRGGGDEGLPAGRGWAPGKGEDQSQGLNFFVSW